MATETKEKSIKKTKKKVEGSSEKMAVIRTGSKQYVVKIADVLKNEKIHDEDIKNGAITFEDVLLVDDGKTTKLGTPVLSSSKVIAEVVEQIKDKKVVVIKYRAKSRYFKKRGHRQPKTFVKITEIK